MYTFTYLTDKGDWLCTNHSMCTYTSRCVSMYVFVCVYVCARSTDQDNCFFGGTPVKAWYSYTRTHTDTSKCECMLYTHTHTHTHTQTLTCVYMYVCIHIYIHSRPRRLVLRQPQHVFDAYIYSDTHLYISIWVRSSYPIDKGGWFWQSQHIDDTNICMHARTLMYVCIHTSTYLTDTIVTSSASTTTCTYYIHTHTHTHTPIYIYMYVYINLHI